ncbi:hypothetical protein TRAPUB_2710 [Trametes pubescens]|uniref:Uncharacterized protein n=1 Tax=Trametes pubescens TaxID=154538 RepID=A0A1M2VFS5_TRAPU|nr:hypothetical protein TRAPUB_2710 [Trametes pubescens]
MSRRSEAASPPRLRPFQQKRPDYEPEIMCRGQKMCRQCIEFQRPGKWTERRWRSHECKKRIQGPLAVVVVHEAPHVVIYPQVQHPTDAIGTGVDFGADK